MPRNVRTYDHFCLLARALERLGDRWSLLVVRDLLSGPKRFTDLMERLGGITPKTLTQRLRELEDLGLVDADRVAGRREVRYQLTPIGADLGPAIAELTWWGWRHAWHPPEPNQPLHPEHLLLSLVVVLDNESDDRRPVTWHLRFSDDGEYTLARDPERWSLRSAPPEGPADVTVETTTAAWMTFLLDPSARQAQDLGIQLTGSAPALRRLRHELRHFARSLAL